MTLLVPYIYVINSIMVCFYSQLASISSFESLPEIKMGLFGFCSAIYSQYIFIPQVSFLSWHLYDDPRCPLIVGWVTSSAQ